MTKYVVTVTVTKEDGPKAEDEDIAQSISDEIDGSSIEAGEESTVYRLDVQQVEVA